MTSARYDGKPLLRLLELYVLWAIAELSSEDENRLVAMAPKLKSTFGGDGSWQSAISASMRLPDDMSELIRANWRKNINIAKEHARSLEPQQFAEMFVDSNLV